MLGEVIVNIMKAILKRSTRIVFLLYNRLSSQEGSDSVSYFFSKTKAIIDRVFCLVTIL